MGVPGAGAGKNWRDEGALLGEEVLAALLARDAKKLPEGLSPSSYGLAPGEDLDEAILSSWRRLLRLWPQASETLRANPHDHLVARRHWLTPLLEELGWTGTTTVGSMQVGDRHFAVAERLGVALLHHEPWGQELGKPRRQGGPSPHGTVQACLNATDEHLWALLTNGQELRLLRDNASLTRPQAWVADLAGIFATEDLPAFRLVWLLAHASRFAGPRDARIDDPKACWLERWRSQSQAKGQAALRRLKDGVLEAISELGKGALGHPGNGALKAALNSGALEPQGLLTQLLRVVYRLLFVGVAEARGVLPAGQGDEAAKRRYQEAFSLLALREAALAPGGLGSPGQHDRAEAFRLLCRALAGPGLPALAVPALGGQLWEGCPELDAAFIPNQAWGAALRALGSFEEGGKRLRVDWAALGAEELGGVFEQLLAYHAEVDPLVGHFALKEAAGNARKTTGSYYTPTSLIELVLDEALEPAIQEARAQVAGQGVEAQAQAILALKVCDPACGSGHFLLAAGHRLAKHLATARTGEPEPDVEARRLAFADVAARCLYGVDLNPMAVELSKLGLWLEALVPGRPLSFLDARIQVGNSLMGATPALLAQGVPDEAWKALSGDDPAEAKRLAKLNKEQRKASAADGQGGVQGLFQKAGHLEALAELHAQAEALHRMPEGSKAEVDAKAAAHQALMRHEAMRALKAWCDAWCAAWAWPKGEGAPAAAPTHGSWKRALEAPEALAGAWEEVARLAESHRYFHWHLAYPEVFLAQAHPKDATPDGEPHRPGWTGGFDVVLGNPPWEHMELKETEWFESKAPGIAALPGAKRKKAIAELAQSDTGASLWALYQRSLRDYQVVCYLAGESGLFGLGARGRLNTYPLFTELFLMLGHRNGIVVPSGVASDAGTAPLFGHMVRSGRLRALLDFENREKLFQDVDSRTKFSILANGRPSQDAQASFWFFAAQPEEVPAPIHRIRLMPSDLLKLNPNTGTCPVFRSKADAELTVKVYDRFDVLWREGPPERNPWGIKFRQGLFNMTSDSHLFKERPDLQALGYRLQGNRFVHPHQPDFLPLYEGKMIHHYDHRWASAGDEEEGEGAIARGRGPADEVLPRYWVAQAEVQAALKGWDRGWLMGWRGIARPTDERTFVTGLFPVGGAGNSLSVVTGIQNAPVAACFYACLCSLVHDYLVCQKMGGTNLNFFYVKQLAIPTPEDLRGPMAQAVHPNFLAWVSERVLRLTYTSHSMDAWARDLGYEGAPYAWDEEERALLRAELDAAMAHLYGLSEGELRHVLDSFPVLRRKEERAFGNYRTAELVLAQYQAMANGVFAAGRH